MNSQDTDADVNLDLESMSKDEVDSYSKSTLSILSVFVSTPSFELILLYSCLHFAADLSVEQVESSSLEKKEKLDALKGGDKDNAIGERFRGIRDASNSDGSVFSEAEKNARATCGLNVPGERSCY